MRKNLFKQVPLRGQRMKTAVPNEKKPGTENKRICKQFTQVNSSLR